jgi:hypothetical protein
MLSDFKTLVSRLCREWEDCLMQSLKPEDKAYFESIYLKTATNADLKKSLPLVILSPPEIRSESCSIH